MTAVRTTLIRRVRPVRQSQQEDGGDERLENGTTNGAAAATTPNPCDGTRTETDPKTGSNESSGDETRLKIIQVPKRTTDRG